MTAILFDLDGTLVDSSQGILAAFRHSFQQLGLTCPDTSELMTFIGPPLEVTFSTCCRDEEETAAAIQHFRDYYDKQGVFQADIYSGVKGCLKDLKAAGHQLFVATSKNEPMAKLMLAELELTEYFTQIYGAVKGRYNKADVIKVCLDDHQLPTKQVVMIGDTKFDVLGAKTLGVKAIGVSWGFGSQDELISNGADFVINKPDELLCYFST